MLILIRSEKGLLFEFCGASSSAGREVQAGGAGPVCLKGPVRPTNLQQQGLLDVASSPPEKKLSGKDLQPHVPPTRRIMARPAPRISPASMLLSSLPFRGQKQIRITSFDSWNGLGHSARQKAQFLGGVSLVGIHRFAIEISWVRVDETIQMVAWNPGGF